MKYILDSLDKARKDMEIEYGRARDHPCSPGTNIRSLKQSQEDPYL